MSDKGPTRVLLVDDQSIVLDGLAALLRDNPDFVMVGVAHSGEEAILATMKHLPDVVVMDISMPPGMDGIEATARIKEAMPGTRVLVLTMYHQREMVNEVLEAGASGYLLKNTGREQFCEALRLVAGGLRYLAPEVQDILDTPPVRDGKRPENQVLSEREKGIIKMIVQERSTQEIADELGLSILTVETHRRNIMHKLDVRNMAGLVRYAMERGWGG
ncbi:MAG: response regulator transcription factor [Flavobacteriales bacterium]|nr:response regulator transcription factor [Flavobacteriales bacterium]